MNPPGAPQATFCATLVDEWIRAGVEHAVVAPGSRSTPLALALQARDELRVHVFHDERAAGFCALGIGLASGRPAVVLTTSGTAATHVHAAVVEADLAGVPLIVCTADRPPELRDVGAPQTIDQARLYGRAPRWFFDPGVADDAMRGAWRAIGARAVVESMGVPPGPVHLNLPFRDPLVGEVGVLPPGRPNGAPWVVRASATATDVARVPSQRAVIVGTGPGNAGVPVLADPRAGVTGPCVIQHVDAVLRHVSLGPEVVVRVGSPPASRVVNEWIAASGAQEIVVAPTWRDPSHTAAQLARGFELDGEPDPEWMAEWRRASDAAEAAVADLLDHAGEMSEPFVARALLRALPPGAQLVVASSMPVRDLEWYAVPRSDVRVFANRGANGIDGTIATAIGVAIASHEPTVVLLGDVAFLHDSTALIGIAGRGIDLTLVVVDNRGGGIFSFLPQAEAVAPAAFEQLFGTPHDIDVTALAAVHRIGGHAVDDPSTFVATLSSRIDAGGVSLVAVRTDRAENVKAHRRLNEAVASALGG